MMYNTQDYTVSELCPSSGILNTRKHNVSETYVIRSSGEGKETPSLMGPLETANLNHRLAGRTTAYR
jgi:hypothetical protein